MSSQGHLPATKLGWSHLLESGDTASSTFGNMAANRAPQLHISSANQQPAYSSSHTLATQSPTPPAQKLTHGLSDTMPPKYPTLPPQTFRTQTFPLPVKPKTAGTELGLPTSKAIRVQGTIQRRKARAQVKRDRRAAGFRECRWQLYGCKHTIIMPDSETPCHDQICPFKCSDEVHSLWQLLRNYQHKNPDFQHDLWGIFAPPAYTFLPLTVHDKTVIPSRDEPLVFDSIDIWEAGTPSEERVSSAIFHAVSPPQVQHITILHQLHYPREHRPRDVEVLIDIKPVELTEEFPICLPVFLQVQKERIGYTGYNATPLHAFVDIHVDRGQDTVCAMIAGAEKLWFLWPPTKANEEAFYSIKHSHNVPDLHPDDAPTQKTFNNTDAPITERNGKKLVTSQKAVRIVPLLTGGRIVKTIKSRALYIPAGWIHMVLTLAGGFLGGYTWSCPERIGTLLRCLENEIVSGNSLDDLYHTVDLAIDIIEITLLEGSKDEVNSSLKYWLELIRLLGINNNDWGTYLRGRTHRTMQDLRDRGNQNIPSTCPCGYQHKKKTKFDMSNHIMTHKLTFSRKQIPNTVVFTKAPGIFSIPIPRPPVPTEIPDSVMHDSELFDSEANSLGASNTNITVPSHPLNIQPAARSQSDPPQGCPSADKGSHRKKMSTKSVKKISSTKNIRKQGIRKPPSDKVNRKMAPGIVEAFAATFSESESPITRTINTRAAKAARAAHKNTRQPVQTDDDGTGPEVYNKEDDDLYQDSQSRV